MKMSVWSPARQQSVFQQYHSEKHLSEFNPQDGGESQPASKLRHCHAVYSGERRTRVVLHDEARLVTDDPRRGRRVWIVDLNELTATDQLVKLVRRVVLRLPDHTRARRRRHHPHVVAETITKQRRGGNSERKCAENCNK